MSSRERDLFPNVIQAVEDLSDIADMEIDRSFLMNKPEITIAEEEAEKLSSHDWLQELDSEAAIEKLKNIFHLILQFLRNYCKKHYILNAKETEGLKAIMVLVGEAAKKIDKYTQLFEHSKIKSITELKEYQRLQEFYLNRISKKIDEGVLSKWIMALSQQMLEQHREERVRASENFSINHVFVELDAVKKDVDYELFFIRKEDGSRFFSPRLIRNIKLVCDFGDRLVEQRADDPLESIEVWKDKICLEASKDILNSSANYIKEFYRTTSRKPEGELAVSISKALMALMLCTNPHNLRHNTLSKNSSDYFNDFQKFLRGALDSTEYHKLLAFSTKSQNHLLNLTQSLCFSLFASLKWCNAIGPNILNLIKEAVEGISPEHKAAWQENQTLSSRLLAEYMALNRLLKQHSYGPLIKVLNVLENGDYSSFDPVVQENIPAQQYTVDAFGKKMTSLRIPTPTHQEFINKVTVDEEFKGFLRYLQGEHRNWKYLMINFQDRTSWREHSRTVALEELQLHPDFSKQLIVVTLPKDTDFYNQDASYQKVNQAETFIKLFQAQLEDENCGFFFPEKIKEKLFPSFIEGILHSIHRVFFDSRNVLSRERRLDFIELTYLFIELKLLEIIRPDFFSLTSKDNTDSGPSSSSLLFIFLKWMEQEKLSTSELDQLNLLLHTPSLIIRERFISPSSFNRMIGALKEIEVARKSLGWQAFTDIVNQSFSPFLSHDTLFAHALAA